ncbi:MAG TPA: tetratricopeptide repeat protein, partial [Streptomyces sp.]|nr:tetratricopeptide repeat protein [Streptomyces sp.]
DLDARTGRHSRALARYRAALEAARDGRTWQSTRPETGTETEPDKGPKGQGKGQGRSAPDHLAVGRALESIGSTYEDLGDWERAADWYGRALDLHRTRDVLTSAARLHGRLGSVHSSAGRFGDALREWRAAAANFRRLGDSRAHARALSEVARVQEHADRPKESLRTSRMALDAAQRAGDERLQAALLLRLADACDRIGDVRAGRKHRRAADELLKTQG